MLTGPTQEDDMYMRNVSLKLKASPFSASEFTDIVERNEAVAISFWDKKDSADAYHRKTYPQVLKALSRVVEGVPRVETSEVANSAAHEIAAKSP
jgi:hypothetical protein